MSNEVTDSNVVQFKLKEKRKVFNLEEEMNKYEVLWLPDINLKESFKQLDGTPTITIPYYIETIKRCSINGEEHLYLEGMDTENADYYFAVAKLDKDTNTYQIIAEAWWAPDAGDTHIYKSDEYKVQLLLVNYTE